MSKDTTPDSAGFETRARIDTTKPHSARFWNYFVGGKDNYKVDREIGDQIKDIFPGLVDVAHTSRRFLGRAVGHLAGQQGIRQFLDIGTGLPTADNTHQVAQRVAPDARIVYVDNDPIVLTHANALLTSTPEGRTDYLDADLYDPESVLRAAAGTLDLSRPVALMILNTLGHVADYGQARDLVRRLMAGPLGELPGDQRQYGHERGHDRGLERVQRERRRAVPRARGRGDRRVLRRPGTGGTGRRPVPEWRPEADAPDEDDVKSVDAFCGVGRKL
ncbi:SAM-dependent methyltransferase [Streptomyces sp. INA 01156]